jgi:hypothetical protein
LERRIDDLWTAGQLVDNQTTLQQVLDGVPGLAAAYPRDALRRAAKVSTARYGVSLVLAGEW